MWVALSVAGLSVAGYFIQDQLISFLLRPAEGQQFIYTTPGGGFNFMLQVCIYFGVALSIPVIIYHILKFLEPLFRITSRRFILKATLFSAFLALGGMAFGYFIGLPAAMHFLSSQFTTDRIEALLAVSDYLSFVTIYLAGAAVMFQIPLVLLFINRIKPLTPGRLMRGQRWIILTAFIAAAIITPTPDVVNQAIIAGPIILTYQLGIAVVWWQNKLSKRHKVTALADKDREARALRAQTAQAASVIPGARLAFGRPANQVMDIMVKPVERTSQELFEDAITEANFATAAIARMLSSRMHHEYEAEQSPVSAT